MVKYIDCEVAYRFAQDHLKKETGAYSRGSAFTIIPGDPAEEGKE